VPYATPGSDIVAIIDAPPTPLAHLAPGGRYAALLHYGTHPPVALLGRSYLALAGMRIDPGLRCRRRLRQTTGLSVIRVAGGSRRELALPAGAQIGQPAWAPDGQHFAFTVDEPDGPGVWVADAEAGTAAQLPGLRVCDVLAGEPSADGGTIRWSRDGRSLLALAAPAERAPLPPTPIEPQLEETAGKHSQLATFQDLLRTAADEDAFEALATTVPVRADAVTGERVQLGPPGLYHSVAQSPDGAHLLVHQLRRPFSFRVPWSWFARTVQVWTADGEPERVIADLGVSDEVPRQGVPTGPRQVSWEERAPAALAWTEALDGGDPVQPAEFRDRVLRLAAPFDGEPQVAFDVQHRSLGWYDLNEPHRVLLVEHDRDRRWVTTRLRDLADPARDQVVFDLSADDAYGDPGNPMMTTNADGSRTVLQDGQVIYLRGEGASPDGDRPFLDRLDLATLETARLFQSPADCVDYVLGFARGSRTEVLLWHESATEPPNLALASLGGPGRQWQTDWPDPHPQLSGMEKRLVSYDRGDGVQLSGMLHLPPGYDPATDGRLPLLVWAYPLDFGSASTAGQIRGSTHAFTRLTALDPVFFVLRGYAVLADATMPVIGDPETMNDSYLEQITAAARAHVQALDGMGIIDPARVAVGGHSYGGFMTANLVAHTDLFAAGIARSGAYNRTLTPFGFQTERRSFWEAPEVYDRVSPFRYADKITTPLLLIHGANDSNSGTYPMQSQRLFDAIRGNGGTARLVVLPHENHGYLARESVLHVLAEQFGWLDRWLGGQQPGGQDSGPSGSLSEEPNRTNAMSAPMTRATATPR
jgi:dipeptidyl aminopeptidase/acylaminoacyl peptidase